MKGEGRTPNPGSPPACGSNHPAHLNILDVNGRELPTPVVDGRWAGSSLNEGLHQRPAPPPRLSSLIWAVMSGPKPPACGRLCSGNTGNPSPRMWAGKDPEPRELAQGRAGALRKGRRTNKRPHAPRRSRGRPLSWRRPYCVTAGHRLMPLSGRGRVAGRGSGVPEWRALIPPPHFLQLVKCKRNQEQSSLGYDVGLCGQGGSRNQRRRWLLPTHWSSRHGLQSFPQAVRSGQGWE